MTLSRRSASVGRTYNLTHNRIYGAEGSGGTGLVYNAGNAPTAPLIVIGQSVANPTVGIVDGDKLHVIITTPPDARLEMDNYQRTIMYYENVSSPGVSRRYLMTVDSRWFTFPPGYTEVYYTVATGYGKAYIYWRDAWI